MRNAKTSRKRVGYYNNIGVIYDVFRDYEMGMNYYKKGYELSRLSGDTLNMYNALTNMTGISTLQGDTKSARKYLKLSEEVRDKNNETAFFMSRFNFMLILIFEKKYNEAAKIGQECIAYCNSHNIGKQYLCHTYQKIYKMYMNADNTDSVMKYLQQCLSVAREGNFLIYRLRHIAIMRLFWRCAATMWALTTTCRVI